MSKWFTAAEEPAAPDALELARRAEQAGDHQTAAQLYWHVTQSYVDAGQYDRAAETLEQATRLVPEQADLHNARAQCLIRLGRKVEAAAAFRRAAECAHAQGQEAWARELIQTADWLTPNDDHEPVPTPNAEAGTLPVVPLPSPPMTANGQPELGHDLDLHEAETVVMGRAMQGVPKTSKGQPLPAPQIVFVEDLKIAPAVEPEPSVKPPEKLAAEDPEAAHAAVDPSHVDRIVAAEIAAAFYDDER